MANERRVYANLAGGLVEDTSVLASGGSGLLAAATTLTSAGLVALPVIGATEHLVVVFDPDGLTGTPFAKRVTAHTAAATTATIEAAAYAAEGLGVARDVPKDTPWVAAVLKEDLAGLSHVIVSRQTTLTALLTTVGTGYEQWGTEEIVFTQSWFLGMPVTIEAHLTGYMEDVDPNEFADALIQTSIDGGGSWTNHGGSAIESRAAGFPGVTTDHRDSIEAHALRGNVIPTGDIQVRAVGRSLSGAGTVRFQGGHLIATCRVSNPNDN
jgi:hypothetical protein